ncbi:cobalamin B12-binding domain-containing protein [Shimia ponticola]|uniref:cobalamin B12-binding domain-containing protein n=1 Tax=Shimia ponticola TaxID=2582893 RepID=UPI00164A309A|nr:cobalamin B12-binding domain-containing protein [Shimia ponticola]
MSEGDNKGPGTGSPAATGTVEAFATQVLSLVASKTQERSDVLKDDLFEGLVAAVQAFDPIHRDAILERFDAAGVQPQDIIDVYIPAAARHFGDSWCEDSLSFADVTIGVARLQGLTRDLRAAQTDKLDVPAILLVVPAEAYHTLGATVVADQLRRHGVVVKLAMGYSEKDLRELLKTHDFDAVLISAAACERLETIRNLVKTVKTAAHSSPPVVLGGTVLDQETDIRSLTGADHIANNAEEALRICGLTIQTPDDVSRAAPDLTRG